MKGETKESRFIRVAEKRVQRVLDSLRSLSQCSNKRMYKWNDAQIKKIWTEIEKELNKCKESYKDQEPQGFKF